MGCRLSSHAKPETVSEADTRGTQQDNASVEQGDYIDGVDISHVSNIRVTLYGNSTELNVYAYTTSIEDPTIVFRGAYHVIIEKLKMCLKRKRKFIFYIWLFDECVWSPPSVNAMANLFLNVLPAINDLFLCGSLTNMNVLFIDFYRKLHPIVERLFINNPTIVRFLIDLQIKSLTVESDLDLSWLSLSHIEVNEFCFWRLTMAETLCQQDIVMPSVRSVNFYTHHEAVVSKLILENICNLFPLVEELYFQFVLNVEDKNEPIRNHELFTHTRTLFDTFESLLDWNQGKLKITIVFQVHYNGLINKELARRMTEYIGYECICNGAVGLDVSMSNVNLAMVVGPK
ncbi:unnamed protein product [Bursaphelenchus okinawaensis]|uniref:Uncharacterized protein n=1 Tax=Bursaphelenchus okinawaensis TaxID=465554 RepID=A0A811LQ71_9BILA|nr:unnamed protein product [Bursaphelenchus okinawaensis]CAG9127769.1 unnamed protein product [Bursaphelenchus okinawaensis]